MISDVHIFHLQNSIDFNTEHMDQDVCRVVHIFGNVFNQVDIMLWKQAKPSSPTSKRCGSLLPCCNVVRTIVRHSIETFKFTLKLQGFTKLHHCLLYKIINVSISKENWKYSLSLIEILNVKIFIQLNRCIFSQATESDWTRSTSRGLWPHSITHLGLITLGVRWRCFITHDG